MTTVIRAENIGRQYLIRHERQGQRFVYDSLGESLVNGGRAFFNRLLHPFASRSTMSTKEEFWQQFSLWLQCRHSGMDAGIQCHGR